jgi:hypothetical protein
LATLGFSATINTCGMVNKYLENTGWALNMVMNSALCQIRNFCSEAEALFGTGSLSVFALNIKKEKQCYKLFFTLICSFKQN